MTAPIVTQTRRRVRLRWRLLGWTLLLLAALPFLLAAAAWAYGPYWIAPVDDFAQGPGGAVAYVSLYRQLQQQSHHFWTGGDVRISMNQAEFSGMLSSALLSGRTDEAPVRKVRAGLVDGEIRVETVLRLRHPQIPERYQGPVGLKLRLHPDVDEGQVRFRITRATLGRIPIPTKLIQWAGRLVDIPIPGFNPAEPAILLPVSDMVTAQWGRQITIKQFTADDGQLALVMSMERTVPE